MTHLIPTQNYKENVKRSQHLVQENFFQTPDWQPKDHKILSKLLFAFFINPATQTRVYSKFIMVNKKQKTHLLHPALAIVRLSNPLIGKPRVLQTALLPVKESTHTKSSTSERQSEAWQQCQNNREGATTEGRVFTVKIHG